MIDSELYLSAFSVEDNETIKYNSHLDKTPFGAVKSGTECVFTAQAARRFSSDVWLVIQKDGEDVVSYKMNWQSITGGYDNVAATVRFDTGLYWYHFNVGGRDYYKKDGTSWQLTVYDENFTTPDWIKGGIIYHIFVDRFNKNGDIPPKDYAVMHENLADEPIYYPDENGVVRNVDFYGGNLQGIIEKLDYISSLGVNAIYLSPIFDAESNHKYDTGDYEKIDPMFGTEDDLAELAKKAEKLGIRLICDGVFNHTGSVSRYFNKDGSYGTDGAYKSQFSKYAQWYDFQNWPDEYSAWWGIKTLPAINKTNADFRGYITGDDGVMSKWMRHGVSSWRLDVADELSDEMLCAIRYRAKSENPDSLIIGEVWEDASNKCAYGSRRKYLLGDQLDSVMNYPLKDAILDFLITSNPQNLVKTVHIQQENYPQQVVHCLMNIIGTHDTMRALTFLGCRRQFYSKDEMSGLTLTPDELETGIARLKCAALLQMLLPGVPCIYYGDEAGMQGGIDPFNRMYFPWGKENTQLQEWYKSLAKIRRKNAVFKDGGYRQIYASDGKFVFMRTCGKKSALVGVNMTDDQITFKKPVLNELSGKKSATVAGCFVIVGDCEKLSELCDDLLS